MAEVADADQEHKAEQNHQCADAESGGQQEQRPVAPAGIGCRSSGVAITDRCDSVELRMAWLADIWDWP